LRVELGDRVGISLAADSGDDIPTFGGEMLGDCFADSPRCACDEY
jgi:hypothetical protein